MPPGGIKAHQRRIGMAQVQIAIGAGCEAGDEVSHMSYQNTTRALNKLKEAPCPAFPLSTARHWND
jgi:hypothetical protein